VVNQVINAGMVHQVFMVQHPTNWNQFRDAIDAKFVGAGGEVEDTYVTNRSRYMDTIIKPTFEGSMDKEGCVNTHFAMSQEKQGLWFAHLTDVDPAYDLSSTSYTRVRFPQSWTGTDASYRWSLNHLVNDYHATTYSAAYIWSQWNGVSNDPATREFFNHFTRNMGHTYDTAYGHVNTAASQQLSLSKLYSHTDDWSDLRNSELTRGEVNAEGVVVDTNGNPILAETETIVPPADPMLGLSVHNTTAVWRDIVLQMKDALEADN
jgi:hypothetical protein